MFTPTNSHPTDADLHTEQLERSEGQGQQHGQLQLLGFLRYEVYSVGEFHTETLLKEQPSVA